MIETGQNKTQVSINKDYLLFVIVVGAENAAFRSSKQGHSCSLAGFCRRLFLFKTSLWLGGGGGLLLGVVTPGCMTGKEESVLVAEDGEERGRERGKEEKLRAGLVNLCRTVRWL